MLAVEKRAFGVCANGLDSYESHHERIHQQDQHLNLIVLKILEKVRYRWNVANGLK